MQTTYDIYVTLQGKIAIKSHWPMQPKNSCLFYTTQFLNVAFSNVPFKNFALFLEINNKLLFKSFYNTTATTSISVT